MKEWLKKSANPVDKEDLERHDKWLCMMWPRLNLLKELLHEDGILFISIDDNEADRLQVIIEEIFGEDRLLGRFVWKSRQNKDNRNICGLSIDHEYVLIVGRQIEGDRRSLEGFLNPDNDPRGPWSSGNMVGLASKKDRPNLHYDLVNPKTQINYGCPPRGWRYEKMTMDKLISENCILWPTTPNGRPREKAFLGKMADTTNTSSVISLPIFTRNGTDAFERIMGSREFSFPKPPELVEFLITQIDNCNAIILDSFAGSGTTAHAVLEANRKDKGNRRFILVECEDYADTLTAERVRRVIDGYAFSGVQRTELYREKITWSAFEKKHRKIIERVESIENLEGAAYDRLAKEIKDGVLTVTGERRIEEIVPGLGGSFTFCTLGDPIEIESLLTGKGLPGFETLARYVFYTVTGRSLETVATPSPDGFIGETDLFRIHLFYQPDTAWLRSNEAALNAERVTAVAKSNTTGKRAIVFAVAKFMSQKELTKQRIEFCQLPYAVHRLLGD
jgi:adenine-specific DNA-methyltransferase